MSRRALLLTLAVLAAGCVVGDRGPEQASLEAPTFAPVPQDEAPPEQTPAPEPGPDEPPEHAADAPATDAPAPAPAAPPTSSHPAPTDETPPGTSPTPGDDARGPQVLRAQVTDPRGDTQSTRVTPGPRHADLVGGLLERHPDAGYRLTIDLDGGVPHGARDGSHTMNVASFYDLTGDGNIDVEVWANLADGGWDTSWFDNRDGAFAFSDDDPVSVAVEDARLVLRFPLEVLDGATAFRWAVASEWGRYEQLGTPLSVRDQMPDDGRPAPFPG